MNRFGTLVLLLIRVISGWSTGAALDEQGKDGKYHVRSALTSFIAERNVESR